MDRAARGIRGRPRVNLAELVMRQNGSLVTLTSVEPWEPQTPAAMDSRLDADESPGNDAAENVEHSPQYVHIVRADGAGRRAQPQDAFHQTAAERHKHGCQDSEK